MIPLLLHQIVKSKTHQVSVTFTRHEKALFVVVLLLFYKTIYFINLLDNSLKLPNHYGIIFKPSIDFFNDKNN